MGGNEKKKSKSIYLSKKYSQDNLFIVNLNLPDYAFKEESSWMQSLECNICDVKFTRVKL